jgi:hypothetical protein
MECPICHQHMKMTKNDSSYDRDKKEFSRKVYHCEEHDTWIKVEIPVMWLNQETQVK